jgi:hypothetical protein
MGEDSTFQRQDLALTSHSSFLFLSPSPSQRFNDRCNYSAAIKFYIAYGKDSNLIEWYTGDRRVVLLLEHKT